MKVNIMDINYNIHTFTIEYNKLCKDTIFSTYIKIYVKHLNKATSKNFLP